MDMMATCRAIYKGDLIHGIIYLIIGSFLFSAAVILYIFTTKSGWFYLSVGLAFFSVYAFAKGISVYFVSKTRLAFYVAKDLFGVTELKQESEYTRFRLEKKAVNRRRYMYTFVIGTIILIAGIFMPEKGLILGTIIPIVLFSSIEFVIGLAAEYRLWEYTRIMEKFKNSM